MGVVRGIENDIGVRDAFEPTRPDDRGESVADDIAVDGELDLMRCGHSHGCILLLVKPWDVDVVAGQRVGDNFKWGALGVGFLFDDSQCCRGLTTADDGFFRNNNPGFFSCDGFDGVA